MKLVINIPCFNEEKTLPIVLAQLPKKIRGVDKITVQIVDDGSLDKTAQTATKAGKQVIKHKKNLGLGISFKDGLDVAIESGADIFVNTDADNQYPSRYIPELIKPILDGTADIVIGNREPWKVKHFSPLKRILQFLGNMMTRYLAGSDVPDTVSGFRAYSREAMLKLNVTTKFSYVLDTIVQAERKNLVIKSIPIEINPPTRKSRLFKNIFQHIYKSASNVLRCYIIYEPFRTFMWMTAFFALPGVILLLRFFILFKESGHIQSLIVASFLFALSGIMFSLGIIGEILAMNRKLNEEELYLQKKEIYKK